MMEFLKQQDGTFGLVSLLPEKKEGSAQCVGCECKEPLQMGKKIPTTEGELDLTLVRISSIHAQGGVYVVDVVDALLNGKLTSCHTFQLICKKFERT